MPPGISSDPMIPGHLYPGTGASSMSCSLVVLILCFATVLCLVILIGLRGGPHQQLLCQLSGMCCCLWWAVRTPTCARMQRREGEQINRHCLFLNGEWSHILLRGHVRAAAVVGLPGLWVALMYWGQCCKGLPIWFWQARGSVLALLLSSVTLAVSSFSLEPQFSSFVKEGWK